MVETTKSIIDIAIFYGYGSQEAFTRAFKEMYGLKPKAYRVNKRQFELKLELCDTYDFELFDETFAPNDYESKYYLYVPIK